MKTLQNPLFSDYVYTVWVEEGRVVSTWHGPGCREVTGYEPEDFVADSALWWRTRWRSSTGWTGRGYGKCGDHRPVVFDVKPGPGG